MLILSALLATTFQATYRANIPAVIFGIVIPLEIVGLIIIVPSYGMLGASIVFGLTCTLIFIIQLLVYRMLVTSIVWADGIKWFSRYGLCLVLAVLAYSLSIALSHIFFLSACFAGLLYIGTIYGFGIQQIPIVIQSVLTRVGVRG